MRKTKLTKPISMLLCVLMVFSTFAVVPFTTASAITQSEFDNKLNEMKNKYPDYSGWYDSFDGGSQCFGFAYMMAYNFFGSSPRTWNKVYSIDNVKTGDVLQYGNTSGQGHTVFVTSVSTNYISFVDCNGKAGYCKVKWDNTIPKYSNLFGYSFSYLLSSPAIEEDKIVDDTIVYENLGDNFYAYIVNNSSWLYLSNDNLNVSVRSATYLSEQIWHFIRNSDGSYLIKSAFDDNCLDVDMAQTSNGTNVKACYPNGGSAQDWYIEKNNDAYFLKSKLGNCYLDVAGGSKTSGANIQICEKSFNDAQTFGIYKYNAPNAPTINAVAGNNSVYVNWNRVDGATSYDVYLVQSPYGWQDIKYHEFVSNTSNSCEISNVNEGNYAAFVVARPNDNSVQSNWVDLSVTNNIEAKSIKLNTISRNIILGNTFQLTSILTPTNSTSTVSYTSSNTSVATVDSNGKVTAKGVGSATITAKTSNGKTATCSVSVQAKTPSVTKLSSEVEGVRITWGKVEGATQYRVFYKGSSGWKGMGNTTSTSFLDTDVRNGGTYTYTVRCLDSKGNFISSYNSTGWKYTFTQPTVATPSVTKLSSEVEGVRITWAKVEGATQYRVFYKGSSGWKGMGNTTSTSFLDTDVRNGGTYTYTVRCLDSKGNFISSYNSTGWKYTFTQPTVATPQITGFSSTSDGVKITWAKVEGATQYRVFYKGKSGWKGMGNTTGTSFVDDDVRVGGTYTYTVRCLDSKGNFISSYNGTGWKYTYNP